MALNAYLKLVGQKSGEIKGSVTQNGREGKIMVIAVSHDIVTPRDPVSGLPIGKRQHTPLIITKELDAASAPLHQVQASNENLKEWELQFWTPQLRAGTGTEAQHFTIRLTNASIAALNMRMPNNKHADLMKLETFEEVAFSYQRIEWTWTDGGVSTIDDWEAPIA
jgi:type VI secretion system secreted protein Hcp